MLSKMAVTVSNKGVGPKRRGAAAATERVPVEIQWLFS